MSLTRNPMALGALMLNLLPFLTGLAMLGLKWGIGPRALLFWASQLGGFFLFGSMVVGSALTMIAAMRAEGRDWLVTAAALLWILAAVEIVLFFAA
ncbi:MAG: hypothetical protein ACOY93_17140 [Bacillota bacterium]